MPRTVVNYEKWDRRFLGLCDHVAMWSKDPDKKVGAVLVRPDKSVASMGFNGFPPGMEDKFYDRSYKKLYMVHAEDNCLSFNKDTLDNSYTLYTSFCPCSGCVTKIHNAGVTRVVTNKLSTSLADMPKEQSDKWKIRFTESLKLASKLGLVTRFI